VPKWLKFLAVHIDLLVAFAPPRPTGLSIAKATPTFPRPLAVK
jgi:hypothetical protein